MSYEAKLVAVYVPDPKDVIVEMRAFVGETIACQLLVHYLGDDRGPQAREASDDPQHPTNIHWRVWQVLYASPLYDRVDKANEEWARLLGEPLPLEDYEAAIKGVV